jgi:bifunctional non-homologous end joining protein LigD
VTKLVSRIGFVEPMLPALVDQAPAGPDWIHELKYDGYRTQLALSGGDRRAYTRRGHDWSHLYGAILDVAGGLDCRGALIDGEMIVQDSLGLSDFEALRSALARRKPGGLVFMAFDLLHLDGEDLRREPVEDRRDRLRDLLGANRPGRPIQFSDHVAGGGPDFFAAAEAMGLEGIVSKKTGSRYRSGPARAWVKTKAFTTGEFVVVGATKGDLAPVALLARETGDRRLEYAGGAMVTFDEADRERFWRATERLEVPRPPLHIDERPNTTWLRPEIRVRVRHLRGEEKLRHATVKAIAYLPPAQNPSARYLGEGGVGSECRGPAESRNRLRSSRAPKAGEGTSPEKVTVTSDSHSAGPHRSEPSYTPEAIPARADLLAYYREIGPLILPFLAGRPLNLFRCPKSRGGRCVFQRNLNHPATPQGLFPAGVRRVPVLQKNGRTEDYLYIDDLEGLLACVEADAVEFHGWGSRIADVEKPDRIAFDLDPDEAIGFEPVKAAAFDLRRGLEALGLRSWPLLTGGKGVHVVVPLTPSAEWPEVRTFARNVCAAIAEADPARFTIALPKPKRKGRIFLDYLRNQRTATAIMPWSARARAGAPVAAPLAWKELEAVADARAFAIPDAAALRRRSRSRSLRDWGLADQLLPS